MTRIRSILQGFVDINLETDENVNTTIDTSSLTDQFDSESPISVGSISLLDSGQGNNTSGGTGFTFIESSIGLPQ